MFSRDGSCNTATLIRAVEKAVSLKPDIVLIGANMDENIPINSIPARKLTSLLSQIPWVIIPAGNKGCSKSYISQPAGLTPTTICVGAFGVANNTIFVPLFSQRQQGSGPDILAPGYRITSTGVPYSDNQDISQTLSGTSSAAAITAGFIALLLGEFKKTVTRDKLIEIIHSATWQFNQGTPEYTASTYGILDMRLALFTAHVIQQKQTIAPVNVKQQCMNHGNMEISFLNSSLQKTHYNKKLKNKMPHTSLQSAIQNCIKHLKI
jgi:subtilisin family serine protease